MVAVAKEEEDVSHASDPEPARAKLAPAPPTPLEQPKPPPPTSDVAALRTEIGAAWKAIAVAAGIVVLGLGALYTVFTGVTEKYVQTREDIAGLEGQLTTITGKIDDLGKRLDRLEDRVNKAGIPSTPVDAGVPDADGVVDAPAVFATVTARCNHATVKVNKYDEKKLTLEVSQTVCIDAGKRHAQVFDTKSAGEHIAKRKELAGTSLTWTAQADPAVTCSCMLRLE